MLWSDDHTGNIKEFANPRILQDGEFFAHIEFNQHGAGASKSKKMQHHKRPNSFLAFADAHVVAKGFLKAGNFAFVRFYKEFKMTKSIKNSILSIHSQQGKNLCTIRPIVIIAIKNARPNA